jgi:hypothetical protein
VRQVSWLVLMVGLLGGLDVSAQQRRPQTGPVTFAIRVTDTDGTPLGGVDVTVDGPVKRKVTTEGGRIALENLPSGAYHFTFERDGFYMSQKDVTGRGSKPIDVTVTMTPRPKPVPELKPPPPPEPPVENASPVLVDLPAFIEKNYVGRAAGKTVQLACSGGGTSTLIQINEPIAQHTHADADEFIYVIAGEGTAHLAGREERLRAGYFLMVPRGTSHAFSVTRKGPLVMLSTRAGEKCGA